MSGIESEEKVSLIAASQVAWLAFVQGKATSTGQAFKPPASTPKVGSASQKKHPVLSDFWGDPNERQWLTGAKCQPMPFGWHFGGNVPVRRENHSGVQLTATGRL